MIKEKVKDNIKEGTIGTTPQLKKVFPKRATKLLPLLSLRLNGFLWRSLWVLFQKVLSFRADQKFLFCSGYAIWCRDRLSLQTTAQTRPEYRPAHRQTNTTIPSYHKFSIYWTKKLNKRKPNETRYAVKQRNGWQFVDKEF